MRKTRTEEGFTLIEVLVALVVLSVGIGAMLPVLIHTVRGNLFGNDTTQAATLTQDKLEELRTAPFNDAALAAGTHPATVVNDRFSRGWVVVGYGAAMKGIEVTTSWTDARGTHVAQAFTVKANYDF